MINYLSTTLKNILDDTSLPQLVRDADVAFDRPAESYNPSTSTINLYLFDVRENTELRSNEPIIDRQNGIASIRRPPLRVSCSYLVSAWTDSSVPAGQAVLEQHQLLGEVLRVFSRWPAIPLPTPDGAGKEYLQGELKNSLYPISLVTAQTDLVRNPAEFWTAIGGKLRPSFTITATIAIDQDIKPVEAKVVSSSKVTLGEKLADSSEFKDKQQTETWFDIAGIVTDQTTGRALNAVEITLVETGQTVMTDTSGQYQFSGLKQGSYKARVIKQNYSTVAEQVLQVPGTSPTAFDIKLSPL